MSTPQSRNKSALLSELFYERETEYYGMTPYALLDRIGSMIVDCYFEVLNGLQGEQLPRECPFLSETQIAAALTQWSLLVEGTIDKNFELFETYIMKNILALPLDFPVDKYLEVDDDENKEEEVEEEVSSESLSAIKPSDLEAKIDQLSKRIENATLKNKALRGEDSLLTMQEGTLQHFETHLSCIKGLLSQYKIDSLERSMSSFVKELISLKYMVNETLIAGSNYLFAKYDSEVLDASAETPRSESIDEDSNTNNGNKNANNSHPQHSTTINSQAYNRILSEMAGLSTAQTVEQIDARRREISAELNEKNKISGISDFEKFRLAIQKLSSTAATA